MKKIIFFSVVLFLLVAPAWAEVTITTTVQQVQVKDPVTGLPIMVDTDAAIIGWSSSDANRVRAFALDITLDKPAGDAAANPVIKSVTVLNAKYWVYPGQITIVDGNVTDYGTPVGDPCVYPGTLPGLDSNGVTVELGSLYVGGPNAPPTAGNLLKIVVNDNCVIKVAPNEIRGGVVMEDGSSGTIWPADKPLNLYTRADKAVWRAVGRPKCWCRGINARQCHGDADGLSQQKQNYWVFTNDLTILQGAWQIAGGPLTTPGICADYDHLPQQKANFRVFTNDLTILQQNWQKANLPDCNCP